MIGVGLIRADLVRTPDDRERCERILRKAAASDGLELAAIVIYDPAAVDLMLADLANAGPEVTAYTPQREHVRDVVDAIREHAGLVCVLNDIQWPGRRQVPGDD